MRSDKLNYFLFFALSFLGAALGMILINEYAKQLLTNYNFPQSNTIPQLLAFLNLSIDAQDLILQSIMTVNLVLMFACYAHFLIYIYFIPFRKLLRKRFGLIYDIITNAPVPFAVIKLHEHESGKVVKQTVTDIDGRYNLVADKGNHYLTIEHGSYVKYRQDLDVNTDDLQITHNIPLAPVTAGRFTLITKRFLNSFSESNAEDGLGFTLLLVLFSFNIVNLIILLVFAVQFLLERNRVEPRNWGYVYDVSNNKRLKGAFVSVFSMNEHRQLGSQMTDEKGRYGFILEEKSQYLIKVTLPGYMVVKINQPLTSELLSNGEYAIRLPSGKVNDLDIGLELKFIDPSRKAFT